MMCCRMHIMKRTQIQLPDPLYREVRRVADLMGWSVTEVLRRGAEYMARRHPAIKDPGTDWRPPAPRSLGQFKAGADDWRDIANEPAD